MTTTIDRAGKALRQDVWKARRREIERYNRDEFFKWTHLPPDTYYGDELATLAADRCNWPMDADYTRLLIQAIRRRYFYLRRHPWAGDATRFFVAYVGERRIFREQLATASHFKHAQAAVDLVTG